VDALSLSQKDYLGSLLGNFVENFVENMLDFDKVLD
jgi:hypothetical protein